MCIPVAKYSDLYLTCIVNREVRLHINSQRVLATSITSIWSNLDTQQYHIEIVSALLLFRLYSTRISFVC